MKWSEIWPLLRQARKESKRSYFDLLKDLRTCYSQGFNWGEYFIFGFQFNQSSEYRRTFVCNRVHYPRISKHFPMPVEAKQAFDDKGLFNRHYKDLKGIETLDLRVDSYESFLDFTKRHEDFFVKSPDGCGGKEVNHVYRKDFPQGDIKKYYEKLIQTKYVVVEERIIQHEEVSKLSLHAVNTIRVITLRDKDGVIKAPFVASRIAIGDSYKDNCSLGGASTPLEADGIVRFPYFSNIPTIQYFEKNKYTGFPFIGFQFPYFKEAIELCLTAFERSQAHYIGWDVAISKNGPVLIEANAAPSFDLFQAKGQLAEEKGRLDELEAALKVSLRS